MEFYIFCPRILLNMCLLCVDINPLDPTDLPSNMLHFPRISQNSLKISPKFRANIQIQSLTSAYLLIKTKSFLLHFKGRFFGFKFIYWNFICGKYFSEGSILGKNGCFPGRLQPDWGNTPQAAMVGLGSTSFE